ncbi:MAG: DUF6531 domain-containing protein, partial [Candidatus Ozemobacteraceae bacterium]
MLRYCRPLALRHGMEWNGRVYPHDMFITSQLSNGSFEGYGGHPAGQPYVNTWKFTAGSEIGGNVTWTILYILGPAGIMHATGNLFSNGSMGGNWSDNCPYPRTGTWTAQKLSNITNIYSVKAEPEILNIGSPAPEGTINFTATVNESTNVTFSILQGTQVWDIGVIHTIPAGSYHVATLNWAGNLPGTGFASSGLYTVKASASGSHREQTFTVNNALLISVTPIPNILYIDRHGAGSGIVFRAATSDVANVSFTVTTPTGQKILIGEKGTTATNSTNIAKMSWGGNSDLTTGSYTITASIGDSQQVTPFDVIRTSISVNGLSSWIADKDPTVALTPPKPKVAMCLVNTWEKLLGRKAAFFDSPIVGDPVNTVSGDFILPETDLSLKSRMPLVLARVYNSLDSHIGPFGRGWSSPYLSRLEITASDVAFVNSDGSRVLFHRDGETITGPADTDLQLTIATDTGFWTLKHPSQGEWTFDEHGQIFRM